MNETRIIEHGIEVRTLSCVGRKKQEIVIIPAGVIIPVHRHPNVEKYIEPIYGKATIFKGDQMLKINGFKHWKDYHIRQDDEHSIEVSAEGLFAYISTQYWTSVKVGNIEEDWIGGKL